MSATNELLWALIGLLLTIFGTFMEVFIADPISTPPWQWTEQAISVHSLGISYQIGAVLITGCLGGKNAGAISQIAYLILGLYFLPVFAKGGELDYIQEPTFGYILGFIPGAWLCGWLAFRRKAKIEYLVFSSVVGLIAIHLVGMVYLVGLSLLNFIRNGIEPLGYLRETIMVYSIANFPAQLILVCLVSAIAYLIRIVLVY